MSRSKKPKSSKKEPKVVKHPATPKKEKDSISVVRKIQEELTKIEKMIDSSIKDTGNDHE